MAMAKKAANVVWKNDIETLFTKMDVDHMARFGVMLDSYTYVKTNFPSILRRIEDKSMPPGNPWPKTRIDRFKLWQKDGFPQA
jgi:hypothetical protein